MHIQRRGKQLCGPDIHKEPLGLPEQLPVPDVKVIHQTLGSLIKGLLVIHCYIVGIKPIIIYVLSYCRFSADFPEQYVG